MNGPELKTWRTSAKLSLVEVAAMLDGQVSQPTLSRWEQSKKPIPQWATDKLLGATKITLALTELHQLLDYARQHDLSFQAILAEAIRAWLAQQASNIITPHPSGSAGSCPAACAAEGPTPYSLHPKPPNA
jgi:transcriptional regulator with XRE-family HTH domain